MDAVSIQRPQPLDARVGLAGRERTRVLRGLTHDQDEPIARAHRPGLVAGRVPGRRQHAHAVDDLAIAVHGLITRAGEVDPIADRVALVSAGLELGALYHDRDADECPVLSTVV